MDVTINKTKFYLITIKFNPGYTNHQPSNNFRRVKKSLSAVDIAMAPG
jgi:hypothetical protein